MKRVSLSLLFLALLVWALSARADDSVEIRKDVAYRADNIDAYQENLCRLDLYLPRERQGVPVLVWLHGGGMTGGDKKGAAPLGRWLAGKGIAVAAADYRLSPRAKYPAYLEDAAQAVAWVRANAADLGIDPARIYVAGHSAGGYPAAMPAMDSHSLKDAGVDPAEIAGFVSVSGEVMTHFTIRAERGLPYETRVCDEAAPLYYTRKETPPMLLLIGDADWPARREENAYFHAALRAAGNPKVAFQVIPHRTHGSIAEKLHEPGDPGGDALLRFIASPASFAVPIPPK